jgi:hypothetical protein
VAVCHQIARRRKHAAERPLASSHHGNAMLAIFFVTTFPGGVSCVNISSAARSTWL